MVDVVSQKRDQCTCVVPTLATAGLATVGAAGGALYGINRLPKVLADTFQKHEGKLIDFKAAEKLEEGSAEKEFADTTKGNFESIDRHFSNINAYGSPIGEMPSKSTIPIPAENLKEAAKTVTEDLAKEKPGFYERIVLSTLKNGTKFGFKIDTIKASLFENPELEQSLKEKGILKIDLTKNVVKEMQKVADHTIKKVPAIYAAAGAAVAGLAAVGVNALIKSNSSSEEA